MNVFSISGHIQSWAVYFYLLMYYILYSYMPYSFLEAILSSPVAGSLSTLPFQVLRTLFQTSAVSPQGCTAVQRAAIEVGAIQMVLLCLAVLSHHKPQTTNHSHKLALQALSALTGR